MNVLVTGFEPFGNVTENPSQRVVDHLKQHGAGIPYVDVVAETLPVSYRAAELRLVQLIAALRPAAILMLGVAQNRPEINLERFALNVDDASIADNDGEARSGEFIRFEAPNAYQSTLPITSILSRLKDRGIPAKISNHAGAYLCNHVFFTARDYCERYGLIVPTGFVHLPAMGDEPPAMPLETIIEGVHHCLDVITTSLHHSYL